MKLILLRHGETAANEEKRYCGVTDLPLSSKGKAQLQRRKAQKCYPEAHDYRFITSGMLRCEQTLQMLYAPPTHTTDAAFREINFGAFEMHTYEELKNDARYLEWIDGANEQKAPPGGESGAQMSARVEQALSRLIAQNEDTLLLTHGGVIAAMMNCLFEKEHKNRYEWQPEPGGGYLIDTAQMTYRLF